MGPLCEEPPARAEETPRRSRHGGQTSGALDRRAKSRQRGSRRRPEAWAAHQQAEARSRRPKSTRLGHRPLAEAVTERLERWWSPGKLARRLPIELPDDPLMRASHETIYQSLFVEGRHELRRELHRTARAAWRARDRIETSRPEGRSPARS